MQIGNKLLKIGVPYHFKFGILHLQVIYMAFVDQKRSHRATILSGKSKISILIK